MHFAAASSKHAQRRIARGGAAMRVQAVVVLTTARGVVALPPRSPGPGRS
jgi:hypothetical protein